MIKVCHIPGRFNILVGHLSRLDRPLKTEWALDQSVVNSIFQMLHYPNVDLFATRFNHKLPLYVSPVPDSRALAVNAFSMNWDLLHAYAFPLLIMPLSPTSKKLVGHIASGHSSVCPSVHPFVTLFDALHNFRHVHTTVLKFLIWIPHEK